MLGTAEKSLNEFISISYALVTLDTPVLAE